MTSPLTGLRALHLLPLLAVVGCSSSDALHSNRPTPWTLDDERAHVARREDPSAWDMERTAGDLQQLGEGRPLLFGAFPVPHYDLLGEGSYGGGGNRVTFTPWNGRVVVGMGFFVGDNPWNAPEVGDREEFVFVHLLVPLEEMPTGENGRLGAMFLSRNHPHVTAQGWFGPDATDVEYVAFQAADGEAWALVNLRLFDLRAGRCILVAPQPDGSLRTRQIDSPPLTPEELADYHRSLLEDPEISAFFETSIGE